MLEAWFFGSELGNFFYASVIQPGCAGMAKRSNSVVVKISNPG
jgi:hypothetical protein